MTPEELSEFEEVLSSLRMHGTDNEYVQEIDSLLTPLIESLKAAHAERDAARAEMDEFAIAVGYGERPEGQGGVHRLHGEQLAARWKQIEKERDEAQAEIERLREVVRQVHALAAKGNDPAHGWVDQDLREIHKITEESP